MNALKIMVRCDIITIWLIEEKEKVKCIQKY